MVLATAASSARAVSARVGVMTDTEPAHRASNTDDGVCATQPTTRGGTVNFGAFVYIANDDNEGFVDGGF